MSNVFGETSQDEPDAPVEPVPEPEEPEVPEEEAEWEEGEWEEEEEPSASELASPGDPAATTDLEDPLLGVTSVPASAFGEVAAVEHGVLRGPEVEDEEPRAYALPHDWRRDSGPIPGNLYVDRFVVVDEGDEIDVTVGDDVNLELEAGDDVVVERSEQEEIAAQHKAQLEEEQRLQEQHEEEQANV